MKTSSSRSVAQIVEEQVRKWRIEHQQAQPETSVLPTITLSREPGSGGRLVAEAIAERLELDLFHQEVIHEMAKSAQVSTRLVESLDEKGLSMIEDWIASAVHKRHLWPDEYLTHLLKVIGTIGKHGHAVIVGRGANFILPPSNRFRIRIIAPREFRIDKMAKQFGLTDDEAERRILKTDSERRAFIRKYFHADIADPQNYDIIFNTGTIDIAEAATAVCSLLDKTAMH
jgi:cytidylate kinase